MSDPFSAEDVQAILSRPSTTARRVWLEAADSLSIDGLEKLLTTAAQQLQFNALYATQLLQLVNTLASSLDAQSLMPRSTYLMAQAEAMQGNYVAAQQYIEQAHAAYMTQGDTLAGWRTTLGLMQVLGETGAYLAAVEESKRALAALDKLDEPGVAPAKGLLLLNQGFCLHHMGMYEASLAAYDQAAQLANTFLPVEQIKLAQNRALALAALGRFSDALQLTKTTLAAIEANDMPVLRGRQLMNLGHLQLQTGHYHESMLLLEEARQLFLAHSAEIDELHTWLDLGEVYQTLNLLPEAHDAFERAERGFQAASMPHDRARALFGMANILTAQGKVDAASITYGRAIDLFHEVRNGTQEATVSIELASLQLKLGQTESARATVMRAMLLATTPLTRLFAHLRTIDLFLQTGEHHLIEPRIASAQAIVDALPLPHLTYLLSQRIGRFYLQQQQLEAAERHLLAAVDTIEQLRGTLAQEALRSSFLNDKTDAFGDLIQLYIERNDPDSLQKAFDIAERARARTLVDLMAGTVDQQLATQLPSGASQRLQTLRSDLNALYNQLLDESQSERGGHERLQLRAEQVEREIRHIQLRHAVPQRPDTITQQGAIATMRFADLQDVLPVDLPIVSYHVVAERVVAFVFHQGRIEIVRNLCRLEHLTPWLHKLQSQWNRLRVQPSFVAQHLPRFERSARRVLHAIYELLFAPVRKRLPDMAAIQPLVIIPDSQLQAIPFQALHDGANYLLDSYAISYAPSMTVLAMCRQQPPLQLERSIIFGTSDYGLTQVRDEAEQIAEAFGTSSVYLDDEATIGRLQACAGQGDVLHIASHGLFRRDNPTFSAVRLHDGWVTALDIHQLPQVANHVTLSACETGRAETAASDESLGLARAFLSAGASSLLVTQWLVQDGVAAQLMPHWYKAVAQGVEPALALRAAQDGLRQTYPHPYYWAPFVLAGRR